MNREMMLYIANGNDQALFNYFQLKGGDVYSFPFFKMWVHQNLNDILRSWEINTIFDKDKRVIKHY